jgi:hypothetical protein
MIKSLNDVKEDLNKEENQDPINNSSDYVFAIIAHVLSLFKLLLIKYLTS